MTVASLRGRPLRVLTELAGLLGAEITGTIGFAVCAGLFALLGLPSVTAVGRNLAVRRLSGSKSVLPIALAVIVAAAPALCFGAALLLGRVIGDD